MSLLVLCPDEDEDGIIDGLDHTSHHKRIPELRLVLAQKIVPHGTIDPECLEVPRRSLLRIDGDCQDVVQKD